MRLNRRLAGDVYLGVVPIVAAGAELRFEGDGEPVEWAVKMRRLPDEATLEQPARSGRRSSEPIGGLGPADRRLSCARRKRSQRIADFGRFERSWPQRCGRTSSSPGARIGQSISRQVFGGCNRSPKRRWPAPRRRSTAGPSAACPCDTHGDLRLDHVYFFPDQPAAGRPGDHRLHRVQRAFRFADPVADMAFLAMDLKFARACRPGRGVCRRVLSPPPTTTKAGSCCRSTSSYRAAVRGKVEGIKQAERRKSRPPSARSHCQRPAAYWLLALARLGDAASASRAWCWSAGCRAAGKSTLAAEPRRAAPISR